MTGLSRRPPARPRRGGWGRRARALAALGTGLLGVAGGCAHERGPRPGQGLGYTTPSSSVRDAASEGSWDREALERVRAEGQRLARMLALAAARPEGVVLSESGAGEWLISLDPGERTGSVAWVELAPERRREARADPWTRAGHAYRAAEWSISLEPPQVLGVELSPRPLPSAEARHVVAALWRLRPELAARWPAHEFTLLAERERDVVHGPVTRIYGMGIGTGPDFEALILDARQRAPDRRKIVGPELLWIEVVAEHMPDDLAEPVGRCDTRRPRPTHVARVIRAGRSVVVECAGTRWTIDPEGRVAAE